MSATPHLGDLTFILVILRLVDKPVSVSVVLQHMPEPPNPLESCQHIYDIAHCRTLHRYTTPRHR